jgi:hypothetical protein
MRSLPVPRALRLCGGPAVPIQRFPYLLREPGRREGLLQEGGPFLDAFLDHHIFRVPGHQQHLHIRPQLLGHIRKFATAQLRHDHVGKQQIDRSRARFTRGEAFPAVAGFVDHVATGLQNRASESADRVFVLQPAE